MVVVDSSAWIDFLNDRQTPQVALLQDFIVDRNDVTVGDLILAEVLQGIRGDKDFEHVLFRMKSFDQLTICNTDCAILAARNYRTLRSKGITIRKTIDTLIATRCIMDDIPLLYSDRDFDPFVTHLGLKTPVLL